MSKDLHINVTIPAYNRASVLARAIDTSLNQTYDNFSVTVVDDGSTDGTWDVCQRYKSEDNFSAIRLRHNVGTAVTKNISVLLSRYDALTFHDSDDAFAPNKLELQAKPMLAEKHRADHILNWSMVNRRPGEDMEVDIVLGAHRFIKLSGECFEIRKRVSLVDDFFPNVQFPSQTEGDWCLVNSGLFRRRVFETVGGFLDSVEEDREFRNRALSFGMLLYFVDEPLLDKYEQDDSLTVSYSTGYKSEKRERDRAEVWRRARLGLLKMLGQSVNDSLITPIQFSTDLLAEAVNTGNLTFEQDIPHAKATGDACQRFLDQRGEGLSVAWKFKIARTGTR